MEHSSIPSYHPMMMFAVEFPKLCPGDSHDELSTVSDALVCFERIREFLLLPKYFASIRKSSWVRRQTKHFLVQNLLASLD
jgi:hypothetical protein